MLHINDLTYRIGSRVIFDKATIAIAKNHHVSLVGPNGTGKTTLLRLISGELASDGGSISFPPNTKVGMVRQEAPATDKSLLETVLAADTERVDLLKQAETETDPTRISDIHTRLADIQAHTAPARAARILSGLGFNAEAQERPCSDFSGGWRMRVALASVLFSEPDILLLDEPTNHLDLEATIWLEKYLQNYPHTILMVSHDRDILNSIPQITLHLNNGKIDSYGGGYDLFEKQRRENMERLSALQAKQQDQRRKMQAFVDRFRYKASKAKQAQSRIKAMERMEPIVSVIEDRTVTFDFPSPNPLSSPLITMEKASVGYEPTKNILCNLDLRIDMDDRIGILGANGNGKSTLVKLISDRLKTSDGKLNKSSKLKIGYFAQHQTDELSPNLNAVEQVQLWVRRLVKDRHDGITEEKARTHLGGFGFPQDKADTKISNMSGGEKARLLFSLMCLEKPHVIILDEPTNHLDVDTRQSLIQALNNYDGAVMIISHDPHLLELTCDRFWLVDQGTVSTFDGSMSDYRQFLVEKLREQNRSAKDGKSKDNIDAKKIARQERAKRQEEIAPLKKRLKVLERLVEALNKKKTVLEQKLADPNLYSSTDTNRISSYQIELSEVETELLSSEEKWLELEMQIEELSA